MDREAANTTCLASPTVHCEAIRSLPTRTLPGNVGKYSKEMDKALPGKHTRKLYDKLTYPEARILAQLRTGTIRLNGYLAKITNAHAARPPKPSSTSCSHARCGHHIAWSSTDRQKGTRATSLCLSEGRQEETRKIGRPTKGQSGLQSNTPRRQAAYNRPEPHCPRKGNGQTRANAATTASTTKEDPDQSESGNEPPQE